MDRPMAQIADLGDTELISKLADTKQELFNLRFQGATGQLENTARLRTLKRDIARINMVLRAREIAAAESLAAAGKK